MSPPRFEAAFWEFLTPEGYADFAVGARALYAALGSVPKVAAKLGVSSFPLYRKFRELGIKLNPHGGYRHGRRRQV